MKRREFVAGAAAFATVSSLAELGIEVLAQDDLGPSPERRASPVAVGTGASVPFIEAPLPAVEVRLEGSRYVFGLDTGAQGFARLSEHLITTERIAVTGRMRVSDPSGRNPQEVNVHTISSLVLGDMTFENVEAQATRMLPSGIDGILGLDLFSGVLLTLDRQTGWLQVNHGVLPAADGKTTFQSPHGPTLRVPIVFGDETFLADVDTGQAIVPLLLPSTVALKIADADVTTTTGMTVSGATSISLSNYFGSVTVGSTNLSIDKIGWPSPTPTANLGWQAFRGCIVRIDRANNRVAIS